MRKLDEDLLAIFVVVPLGIAVSLLSVAANVWIGVLVLQWMGVL